MARIAHQSLAVLAVLAVLVWPRAVTPSTFESASLTLLGPCLAAAYKSHGERAVGLAGGITAGGVASYVYPGRWQREDLMLGDCPAGWIDLRIGALFDQQPAVNDADAYVAAAYRVQLGAWALRAGGGLIDQVTRPIRYPKTAVPFHFGRFGPFFEVQISTHF